MAYSDVSLLAGDSDFIQRTRAAVSQEGEADPVQWSNDHVWQMASAPGFGDKYAYALDTNVPRPGWDEAVISDADILSAVQSIRTSP
jgi:hypothetical protein